MVHLMGMVGIAQQLLLLSHLFFHCSSKDVESMGGPNSLLMGGRFGTAGQRGQGGTYQLFLQGNHTEVEAQVGATAQLHCTLTGALADGMVSWVRRRDYHLLTVGRHVYTSDERVAVKVAPDASDWILTLRWVREADAGQYECQVSSHPPQALMINLKVKVAWAEIQGESERYIHSGSALRLVCVLRDITEPPSYVFWFREGRMINYDTKAGVTVKTLKGSSILSVKSVTRRDEGNYSCVASNTTPASVSVHVVQKENPAGLQQETNTEKDVPSNSKPAGKVSSPSTSSASILQFKGKSAKSSQNPAPPAAPAVVASNGGTRLQGPLQQLLTGAEYCGTFVTQLVSAGLTSVYRSTSKCASSMMWASTSGLGTQKKEEDSTVKRSFIRQINYGNKFPRSNTQIDFLSSVQFLNVTESIHSELSQLLRDIITSAQVVMRQINNNCQNYVNVYHNYCDMAVMFSCVLFVNAVIIIDRTR